MSRAFEQKITRFLRSDEWSCKKWWSNCACKDVCETKSAAEVVPSLFLAWEQAQIVVDPHLWLLNFCNSHFRWLRQFSQLSLQSATLGPLYSHWCSWGKRWWRLVSWNVIDPQLQTIRMIHNLEVLLGCYHGHHDFFAYFHWYGKCFHWLSHINYQQAAPTSCCCLGRLGMEASVCYNFHQPNGWKSLSQTLYITYITYIYYTYYIYYIYIYMEFQWITPDDLWMLESPELKDPPEAAVKKNTWQLLGTPRKFLLEHWTGVLQPMCWWMMAVTTCTQNRPLASRVFGASLLWKEIGRWRHILKQTFGTSNLSMSISRTYVCTFRDYVWKNEDLPWMRGTQQKQRYDPPKQCGLEQAKPKNLLLWYPLLTSPQAISPGNSEIR